MTLSLSLPPSSTTPLPPLRGDDTISAIFVLPTNGDSHRHRSAGGDAMSATRARLRAARTCEHVSHENLRRARSEHGRTAVEVREWLSSMEGGRWRGYEGSRTWMQTRRKTRTRVRTRTRT
jgi:hypothetical protein